MRNSTRQPSSDGLKNLAVTTGAQMRAQSANVVDARTLLKNANPSSKMFGGRGGPSSGGVGLPSSKTVGQQQNNNWIRNDTSGDNDGDFDSDLFNVRPATGKTRQIRSAITQLRPGTAISSMSSNSLLGKLNVKTLKTITNQGCFDITPEQILFDNIECNQAYQSILYVQNLSKVPKRIRVMQPRTKKFWVEYDSSQSLAAGMCGKLFINFETNVLGEFSDEIVIEYEDEGKKQKIAVPLIAKKPHPTISFTEFVDLGYVRTSKDVSRIISFRNDGVTPGKVRIAFDHLKSVRFEPPVFIIQPSATHSIKLQFNQKDSGIFRGNAEVHIEGIQRIGRIDISATVVEYNKMILDENNSATSSFDFGELYFGQHKSQTAFLYNNSPKPQKFRVFMKLGIFNPNDDTVTLQTPADQGKEITEQIMSVVPSQGEIKPYSNIKLKFNCNSVASYEHQVLAKKYALSTHEIKVIAQEFAYSALVRFLEDDAKEDPIVVTLQVKGTYPLIRLSKQILKFGECNVHDHRDSALDIENRHLKLPIEVNVERTACFTCDPASFPLLPNQRSPLTVSFLPNNVGQYSKELVFSLLGGLYTIPVKVQGSSARFDPRKKKERGPECGIEDFQTNENFLDEGVNKDIFLKKAGAGKQTFSLSTQVKLPKGLEAEAGSDIDLKKLEEIQRDRANKQKYDGVLDDARQSRMHKEKQKILDLRYSTMYDKLKEKGLVDVPEEERTTGPVDNKEDIVRGDPKVGAPVDLEFELGMVDAQIEAPMLTLPPSKDQLFVLKPIGDYDPVQEDIQRIFDPNPDALIKKLLPERATDPKDVKSINRELSGKELKCVQAGPTVIDFGEIYVCSRVTKTFSVKNDLRDAIKVQIKTNTPELRESYAKPQIIKSSETARFEIVLYSEDVDEEFKSRIAYTINSKHTYEFEVKAKITQVNLKINKQTVRFQFNDNVPGMEVSEQVLIENNGNSAGFFRWDTSSKIFSIEPAEGSCPARGSTPITITYRPTQKVSTRDNGTRYEEDKLLLTVLNGMNQLVKCTGIVTDAKCVIKQTSMELGQVLVGKEEIRTFSFKNQSRFHAIYRIMDEFLPDNLQITSPLSGKIPPDGQIEIGVRFVCNYEVQIESEIKILIRGGKIISLPFSVQTIIPKVSIKEQAFDFGKITALGNQGDLEMTLTNESGITAFLVLDLRPIEENPDAPEGIECLQIVPLDKNLDENTFKQEHFDDHSDQKHDDNSNGTGDTHQMQSDANGGGSGANGDALDVRAREHRVYNIQVKPQQNLRFRVSFSPRMVCNYSFNIPLTLLRYGKHPMITRRVTCQGVKPKFLVDPQVVEFERKIITSVEHQFPTNSEIILSNPEKRSMSWRIDASSLEKDKIFSIHPTQGRVDPGQTLRIKTSFNPSYPNTYEKSVPLFIDDPDLPADQPCCQIQLKGISAYPKLLFDRREVLLPAVPLGVESRCVFYIINDGYDNLKLKHKILEELGQIEIKCNFPEGILVGLTQTKLKVEVAFTAKKPMSFSTKIEFKDNNSNAYTIPVSGTADNCVFTNFPFMQRNKGAYAFKSESEKQAVMIYEDKDTEDMEDDISVDLQQQQQQSMPIRNSTFNARQSSMSSVGNIPTRNSALSQPVLGYTLPTVPKDMLDSGRDFIRQWMNYFVVSTQIQSFPESVVDDNGEQLLELIAFCSGKNPPNLKCEIPAGVKRAEKALLLFKQFDDILRYLKADGALLNHIRPQFLLSFADYHAYVKSLPASENSHVSQLYLKINPKVYQYIHIDAWITLFYQIIKIYYLVKVNVKAIKSIPNGVPERLSVPDAYLNGSNVYSDKEGVVLRWLELNADVVSGSQLNGSPGKRVRNFETDLQDGNVIANLLRNYVGGNATANLARMKQDCTNSEDYYSNCEILSTAFQELKIQTQYNPIDLSRPSAREILLFLVSLFTSLPYYIPKAAPILFSCVLGEDIVKTIEISNPTTKTICYWVQYEGSADFTLDSEDNFRVEPKNTFKYRVKFSSRVSNPQTGRITFTNKKESTAIASAIVFDLKSQITGRVSQQVWNVDCPQYECKEFSLQIQNKFLNFEYGDFMVSIVHEYEIKKPEEKKEEVEIKDPKKRASAYSSAVAAEKKAKKKKEDENVVTLPEVEKLNFPSFFSKTERIKLKRGATFNLQMAFIPLIYENTKCFVIFNDPKVGEFQHEVRGRVDMPELITQVPSLEKNNVFTPVIVDTPNVWNLALPFRNESLHNARKYLEQWLIEKPKLFVKGGSAAAAAAAAAAASTIPTGPPQLTVKQIFAQLVPKSLGYDIEIEQAPANAIFVPKILILNNPSYKAPPEPVAAVPEKPAAGAGKKAGVAVTAAASNLARPKTGVPGGNKDEKKSAALESLTEKAKGNSLEGPESLNNSNQIESQSMTAHSQAQPVPEPETNILPISFFFKNPFKDYVANIVVKNQQRTDVRRYRLVVTSLPKPVKAMLEMTSAARECVMQEIPIVNNTEKDWQLKIALTIPNSEHKSFFVNQPPREGEERPGSIRDFLVKKKTTGNIPLCFFPEWVCKVEAKLSITNPLTSDQFDYDLKGVGEEPLAIDHIVLNSQSRVTSTKEITIHNPTDQPITYTVETDLIGAAGAPSLVVPAKKKATYTLSVHPVMSGQYTGSITFTKPDGTYIWWTVMLNIDSPAADRVIDLITNIRKPLAFDIDLANPSDDVATFEVVFEGEGLLGDSYFHVYPRQSFKYELFYMPLKAGKFKGSVAFLSEKLGEIWYELNMQADDSGVVRLPVLKAELGKTEQHEVTLENPSNEDVKVRVRISNTQNFEVSPETIVIPAYDQVQVNIRYRPNALGKSQTSDVIFETDNIGRWVYALYGEGIPPTNFETSIITVGLNKDFSGLLNFKNPFKDPVQVRVFLDTQDVKVLDAIKLIKRSKETYITIPAGTIYQIPYSFQPKEIRCFDCNVVVAMSDKIQWRFPLHAITESLNSGIVQSFKTKCRVQKSQSFSLNLAGISDEVTNQDTFKFEIKNVPEEHAKIVERSLRIKMTKKSLEHPNDYLTFEANFLPFKPFKCLVDFIVHRDNGGHWKFKLSLEATPPNDDDMIVMSAAIGEKDSVSFKLMNRFKTYATFFSHFTDETDSEFSVTPMTGLLEPAGGRNGTTFVISFAPLEYGKMRQGKLIIETDEMYWSYVLKGVLPKYVPPVITESRFNYKPNATYIEDHDKRAGEKKNFISTNIKNQSVVSPSVKSVKLSKTPSQIKGLFGYVPSLAGGSVVAGANAAGAAAAGAAVDNQSVVSYATSNIPNNAAKGFRVQTAKSIKSAKTIKSSANPGSVMPSP